MPGKNFSASRQIDDMVEAITDRISVWSRPVLTSYELGRLCFELGSVIGSTTTRALYDAVVDKLSVYKLLSPSKEFQGSTVFHLFGRSKSSPAEVACAIDPFAYVSHLSAMEFHGITDRFPKTLFLCSPPAAEWRTLASEKMRKDLGSRHDDYLAAGLPVLRFLPFSSVEGVRVHLLRRSKRGAFKIIKSPPIRVATLGRTFLDMLREPDNCGGIQHVIDTYREYAARYLSLIVEEVDRHGQSIDKVRAGFLLDEVCKLEHPMLEGWLKAVQRGGSRMLDPQGEYAASFSQKWMLSVNVPSLQNQEETGD